MQARHSEYVRHLDARADSVRQLKCRQVAKRSHCASKFSALTETDRNLLDRHAPQREVASVSVQIGHG